MSEGLGGGSVKVYAQSAFGRRSATTLPWTRLLFMRFVSLMVSSTMGFSSGSPFHSAGSAQTVRVPFSGVDSHIHAIDFAKT